MFAGAGSGTTIEDRPAERMLFMNSRYTVGNPFLTGRRLALRSVEVPSHVSTHRIFVRQPQPLRFTTDAIWIADPPL